MYQDPTPLFAGDVALAKTLEADFGVGQGGTGNVGARHISDAQQCGQQDTTLGEQEEESRWLYQGVEEMENQCICRNKAICTSA